MQRSGLFQNRTGFALLLAVGLGSMGVSWGQTLTSISPTSAVVGGPNPANLVLTGTNLAGITQVQWTPNGSSSSYFAPTAVTATQLSFTVPAANLVTQGPAAVRACLPVAGVLTCYGPVTFTVRPAPVISSVTPASVPAGSGSTLITYIGTGFTAYDIPSFNGKTYAGTVNGNGTQLSFTVPAADLTVPTFATLNTFDSVDGGVSNYVGYNIAFQLNSVTPNFALAGNNLQTLVTVTAAGGITNALFYWNTFATQLSTTGPVTDTSATLVIPSSLVTSVGPNVIYGLNPVNDIQSNNLAFNVVAPSITSISPVAITAGVGPTPLTVTGLALNPGTAATTLNYGGLTTTLTNTAQNTSTQTFTSIPVLNTPGVATIQVQNFFNAVPGPASNAVNLTIYRLPVVISVTPATVNLNAATTPITVTGVFNTGDQIVFNGTTYTTSVNGTQLQATIPSTQFTSLGSKVVQVVNPAGALSSTSATVSVLPVISSLNPATVANGSNAFTLAVNTTGGLVPNQAITINFNGTPLTGTYVSATQATATVPANLVQNVGSVPVTISTLGVTSSQFLFTIAPPTVSSVNPPSTGVWTTPTITVTGTNFVPGSIVVLSFVGNASNFVNLNTTYVSSTSVTAVVPTTVTSGPGAWQLTVQNGNATSNNVPFNVVTLTPTVSGVVPGAATAGDSTTALTISGTNFQSDHSPSYTGARVIFTPPGGSPSTLTPSTVTSTSITVSVPSTLLTAAGTATIAVNNVSDLTTSSPTTNFTIYRLPVVTSVSPAAVNLNSPNTQITVTGTFNTGDQIVFNGTTYTTTGNATQLQATIPSTQFTALGTRLVQAVNPAAKVSATSATVSVVPVISSLSPPSISSGSNTFTLTVNTTGGLVPNQLITVNFNGTVLGGTFVNATQATATVPASAVLLSGSLPVTIGTLGVTSGPFLFTSVAPAITSLNPTSTGVWTTPTITVSGTNFLPSSVVQIYIGESAPTNLATTYVNPTTLTAVVPTSITSAPNITSVTVVNGTNGSGSNLVEFDVVTLTPTITSIAPGGATAGDPSTTLTITGTNFQSDHPTYTGSRVIFAPPGGSPQTLTPTAVTSTSITVTAGATLLASAGTATLAVNNVTDATTSSPATNFPIRQRPSISAVTPNPVSAGRSYTLAVIGSNFSSTDVVQLNGQPLTTTFGNSNYLTANLPGTSIPNAGNYSVTVVNSLGAGSNAYSLTAVIELSSITPSTAAQSATAAPAITLNSYGGFTPAIAAQFNSTGVGTTYISPTQIQASLAAGALASAGAFPVGAFSAQTGYAKSPQMFQVTPTGQIATLLPPSAYAGGPQFTLQVTGSNFGINDIIQFNGALVNTTWQNAQTLTATVPAAMIANAGNYPVAVMSGGVLSNTLNFPVTLNITNFTPSTLGVGSSAAVTITLTGGVTPNSVVYYNGTLVNSNGPRSATTITANISSAMTSTAGLMPIFVQDGSNLSNTVYQPVFGRIGLTSLTPPTVQSGANATVIATGVGFTQLTQAYVNGVAVQASYNSPTQLTLQIPGTLLTSGTFVPVLVADNGIASNWLPLNLAPGLSVTSLSPSVVEAGSPAFQLTVNGSGFDSATYATWNAGNSTINLSTILVNSNQMVASVPATLVAQTGVAAVGAADNRGRVSSSTVALTIASPLAITALNPSTAPVGSPAVALTITGTGFVQLSQRPLVVRFGSYQLFTTSVTSTQIQVTIPATLLGASGIYPVSVQLADGRNSNSLPFTVFSNPVITSISPGSVYSQSQGVLLTVTGSGFVPGSTIYINGAGIQTTYVNGSTLTGVLPPFTGQGSESVMVVNPGGLYSNTVSLLVGGTKPSPVTLISINPTTTTSGSPAFVLTANGTGFLPGATIVFGASSIATTFVNGGQLTGQVTADLLAQPATLAVFVTNPDGTSSNGLPFVITGKPVITSLNPPQISAGAPGFQLGIGGSGFVRGATATFGGTPIPASFQSANSILASVPANLVALAGTYGVVVTNPDGTSSNAYPFAVNPLSLDSISPSTADVGSPSITVTLIGKGFRFGASASWQGNGLGTTFVSETTLTALVPASLLATAGTAGVTVTNPDGAVAGPVAFTIRPSLTLTSITPASVAASTKNATLGATGTGFVRGAVIQIGGSPIPTTFLSATGLSGTIPPDLISKSGSFNVTVANPDGSLSNALTLTVTPPPPPPVITSISPAALPAGSAATAVTINGSGFVQGSAVQFNGGGAATTFVSATQLRANLTAGQLSIGGLYPVLVVNPNGDVSNAVVFTVITPLSITSLTPRAVLAGSSDLALSIAGAGIVDGANVQFGSTAIPGAASSSTQIDTTVPASLLAKAGTVNVTVVNPDGTVSNALPFLVIGVPSITLSANLTPAGTNQVVLTLSDPAPADLSGTITLTFVSSALNAPANYMDPAAQFAAGGTTLSFTIPKGATSATLPGNGVFSPGSVAGTLTLTLTRLIAGIDNVLPNPPPSRSFVIAAAAPVITPNTVKIINSSSSGFTVEIVGFSTTRDMLRATLTFTSSSSIDGGGTIGVDVTAAFNAYFNSAAGLANGGAFKLDIPFTVSGADANTITGVSVTMTNSAGTSVAVAGTR